MAAAKLSIQSITEAMGRRQSKSFWTFLAARTFQCEALEMCGGCCAPQESPRYTWALLHHPTHCPNHYRSRYHASCSSEIWYLTKRLKHISRASLSTGLRIFEAKVDAVSGWFIILHKKELDLFLCYMLSEQWNVG
jgi:hypothetical protein